MLLQNPDDGIYVSIDECGRGSLASSVVVACVAWKEGDEDYLIKDSKKLTPNMRNILSDYIKDNAIDYSISFISNKRIDEVNILNATFEGMHECLDKLTIDYDHILIDGDKFKPYKYKPHTCIVRGDDTYTSIAAASILAKVARDEHMKEIAFEYPGYGWYTNMGYGTKEHIEAIKRLGITPYHRRTFCLSFS